MKKAKVYRPPTGSGKKFVKKRLYDSANWVEYRNKFLAENTKCYACGDRARVVDHVLSAKGDESKFWDTSNMIPLCKKCHDFITGTFDRHVVALTEEKMKWIAKKRMETETTVRVKVVPL